MNKFQKYSFKKYNKNYPKHFSLEKRRLSKKIKGKIEHIGSSAVPDLGGKPIIDIAILITKEKLNTTKKKLIKLGYEFIPKEKRRLFFQKYIPSKSKPKKIFHIHLTYFEKIFKEMLFFKDYLIENPKKAKKYEKIKKEACKKCNNTKEIYWKIKKPFIDKIKKRKLKLKSLIYTPKKNE